MIKSSLIRYISNSPSITHVCNGGIYFLVNFTEDSLIFISYIPLLFTRLIANSDIERSSWIQAIQLQRDYWNKSKKSLVFLKDQSNLTFSDSHKLNSSYKEISERSNSNIDRSPLSPKSARKFFSKQFSGDEVCLKERSMSLGRTYSHRPFTISFRKSGSRKGLFSPNKAESIENVDIASSDELFVPSPSLFHKSPLNDVRNDLIRSISFDTMRKPSPQPNATPRVEIGEKLDPGLVRDAKGEIFVKYSSGHFLDEDISDEETYSDYSSQPSTLLGAQVRTDEHTPYHPVRPYLHSNILLVDYP